MPSYIEASDAAANTSTTYSIGMGQAAQGELAYVGDHDWFRVDLQAGKTYTFAMGGTRTSDPHNTYTDAANTYLRLRDGSGKQLAADDDSGPGYNSTITFTAKTSGAYFLDAGFIRDFNTGQYGISAAVGNKAFYDEKMATGALTWENTSWVPSTATEPATVTWGVRKTFDNSINSQGYFTPFIQLSAAQVESVKVNLAKYSDVANITFQQVNPGGTTDNAEILVSAYSDIQDPSGAYAYYPDTTSEGGDIRLNNIDVSTSSLPEGSYSAYTILHEIGHAVGLAHPGDYNSGNGGPLTYWTDGAFTQDNHQYTVMSYFDEAYTGASFNSYPDTLMLYDIYAVQQLYGANMSTRASNTIYGFGSNAGATYNFAINKTPALSIWDAGGIDTINASGFQQNQIINLNEGTFSSVGGLKYNISIAYGAKIENATGGAGADSLYGNALANVLNGGAGADSLTGGQGADLMMGGTGSDKYYVDNVRDRVIEDNVAGVDTVYSSVSFATGSQFIENITLTGSASINATGNALVNTLTGNAGINTLSSGLGNDILNGGAGADWMAGGDGNDTYYIDNAGDRVTEAGTTGTDRVISSISLSLADTSRIGGSVEYLSLSGSANINGTGSSLNNLIHGNVANNGLYGLDGSDTLYGWAGNDILDGGRGNDTLDGGAGNDKYYVDSAGDRVIEASNAGMDVVSSSISFAAGGQHIENILLTGSASINATGNVLNNYLVGNSGANNISGGAGNDMLTGGEGRDAFVFNTAPNGIANRDTITDFNVAADSIWMENAVFTALGITGALAAAAFHIGAGATDTSDRIIYNAVTGFLYYDADGSGQASATQFASLTKGLAMTSADFLVV
ncbi:M10 family metallopeptidase C-terminal domain-containing protein [Phyllobacterium sp. YR531]|uniref:M10 family metallopeptidase C-terminal domain-containing protein n=1 Tax=Phyllobacterium sp. YR531 TaxID=1144343 RepID=UPI00026F759B|nr:M10 family metallopeptidase C-terminal domain-containing protein [Phyllobacterium sp. YR531]EJN01632.1 Ca2+-binding protein, RTX toxin [Phyllobacterium sp. YR531]